MMTPQRISDALAQLLASGDMEEPCPGLYMITAQGLARVQRILDAKEVKR
jgi:predicted transcriptional regulator